MEKKIISTSKAPSAIGPYSQGVTVGRFIYTSGQLPINPKNGEVIALVSYPTYSLNMFTSRFTSEEWNTVMNDKRRPLSNRSIAGEYPPGSVSDQGPVCRLETHPQRCPTDSRRYGCVVADSGIGRQSLGLAAPGYRNRQSDEHEPQGAFPR